MSDRDELALELFIGDNANQPRESSVQDWIWYKVSGRQRGAVDHYNAMAEHALAAGYRKPRTITTAEELEALPFETVIRDGDECVLERWGDLEESGWVTVMVTSFVPRDQITLPATVLYEPEAPK